MAPHTVNLLLTTFPGLGLPSTLSLPIASDSTIGDAERLLSQRLPPSATNLTITTTSNKALNTRRKELVSTLLDSQDDAFLPLRLSAQLCGGKGGFGSQLRAQGGRMSSRKKKGQETNGSNRNLEGRRLRTVTEAKALAEYLAIKPEMDKREKEEKRKRWEQVVKLAEDKMDEFQSGRLGKVDGKWLEDKEEASEKTRAAVIAALSSGDIKNLLGMNESDESGSGSESSDSEGAGPVSETKPVEKKPVEKKPVKEAAARTFFGWDEDVDMSDSDEDDEPTKAEENLEPVVEEEPEPMEAEKPEPVKEEPEEIVETPPARKTRATRATKATTRGRGRGKGKGKA
jgi:hypothetical protein